MGRQTIKERMKQLKFNNLWEGFSSAVILVIIVLLLLTVKNFFIATHNIDLSYNAERFKNQVNQKSCEAGVGVVINNITDTNIKWLINNVLMP